MPQNPIAVQEFRAVGGLSGTVLGSASTGSAIAFNIKSTPGALGQIQCISSGAIACFDAAANLATSGVTVTSAVSSALGGSLNNLFYSNSSVAQGSVINLQYPCANGLAVSVSGGVWAIRFS